MHQDINAQKQTIGIVGIGLMGSSIIASLLALEYNVIAIAPLAGEEQDGLSRINEQLELCRRFDLLKHPLNEYHSFLTVSTDYKKLSVCELVVECIIEDIEIKKSVFEKIAAVTSSNTILASNTSAIPISILQQIVPHPERFIGIHWSEPAFGTRFLEIVCGAKTDSAVAEKVSAMALYWGKEPTVLKKDIRGFITNRLMYAAYREILSLVEKNITTVEDADKVFRYDMGSWMTLMGIFGRMDYMGVKDYIVSFRKIFPELSNTSKVPEVMTKLEAAKARGIQNGRGFYNYTPAEAKRWSDAFAAFNKDIFLLAAKYPEAVHHIK